MTAGLSTGRSGAAAVTRANTGPDGRLLCPERRRCHSC